MKSSSSETNLKGYVYTGLVEFLKLRNIMENFFNSANSIHISSGLNYYKVEKGIPASIGENGIIFNEKMDLRWDKKDNLYSIILLSGERINHEGLKEVKGEWTYTKISDLKKADKNIKLRKEFKNIDLNIKLIVYYKNNEATFTSLRVA